MRLYHVDLEPSMSGTSSSLGFSPDSASLAFPVLKALLIVVFVYRQASTGSLG